MLDLTTAKYVGEEALAAVQARSQIAVAKAVAEAAPPPVAPPPPA
jgi:hypothetical protein